ncbi:MAG: methyl-accepting chemotaxis protein [Solirubrobacterales bacterium]|nr:methyl-accepting chemotaxis protein [Solirubrobacterales bacterium]
MQSPRRFSLRLKLFSGFGAVLILSVLIGVLALTKMSAMNDKADYVSTGVVPAVKAVQEIRANAGEYRRAQLRYMSTDEAAMREKQSTTMKERDTSIARSLAVYAPTITGAADRSAFNRVQGEWNSYKRQSAGLRAAADAGDAKGAMAVYEGPANDTFVALNDDIAKWSALNERFALDAQHASQSTYDASQKLIIILLAIAIGFGMVVAFLLTRSISRGVHEVLDRLSRLGDNCVTDLRGGLQAVSDGDLTVEIVPVTPAIDRISRDEIGDVANAVNDIRANTLSTIEAYNATRASLSGIVGEVSSTAATVSSASQEMASTSEEAGRAVGEIANAVSEMAHGAERQVKMVDGAQTAAQETQHAAVAARQIAHEGAAAAEQASLAMSGVRDSSAEVTEAIGSLAAKSQQIGGIVATITGIAEQTNLLALNAAIEAARAGEQGRGFAVVAEEVRKLAEESQQAAATIGDLITQVRSETDHAVAVVEAGAQRSQEGAVVVEQARAAFVQITEAVQDVSVRIDAISQASSEIASVAEQSSASTEQVSASTQQTSASAQQIAASAEELAATAHQLETLVARFQLA